MIIADASGLPLAVHTAAASPHEITLVEVTLTETVGAYAADSAQAAAEALHRVEEVE
jgi:hypothetical protein